METRARANWLETAIPEGQKEAALQYKTITQTLLEQRPMLHERLRQERMLLQAINLYATELKARHEALIAQLSQSNPENSTNLIASQALEIAVKEMEDSLPPASPQDETEALSLDQAMAYLRNRMPPV